MFCTCSPKLDSNEFPGTKDFLASQKYDINFAAALKKELTTFATALEEELPKTKDVEQSFDVGTRLRRQLSHSSVQSSEISTSRPIPDGQRKKSLKQAQRVKERQRHKRYLKREAKRAAKESSKPMAVSIGDLCQLSDRELQAPQKESESEAILPENESFAGAQWHECAEDDEETYGNAESEMQPAQQESCIEPTETESKGYAGAKDLYHILESQTFQQAYWSPYYEPVRLYSDFFTFVTIHADMCDEYTER